MFGSEAADDNTQLTPSVEEMTPEDKEKRLAELRDWKAQVETGMSTESHPDDAEQLEKIEEEIRKLEQ